MLRTDDSRHDKVNARHCGPENKQLMADVAGNAGIWWPPHRVHVESHCGDYFDNRWTEGGKRKEESLFIIILTLEWE